MLNRNLVITATIAPEWELQLAAAQVDPSVEHRDRRPSPRRATAAAALSPGATASRAPNTRLPPPAFSG